MSQKKSSWFSHELLEKNIGLLIAASLLVVSFAGLTQIVPLFFQHSTMTPVEGVEPYSALRLAGRDIYIREGCVSCHSQQVRTLSAEVQRYGAFSTAGEGIYERPFLWGSKRTGPDLARVGQRYSDEWHRVHLYNPRDVVPESNMPAYPWLRENLLDTTTIQAKMEGLRRFVGTPYTDEEIAAAPDELKGKTEEDAVVAYLQGLGIHTRQVKGVQ